MDLQHGKIAEHPFADTFFMNTLECEELLKFIDHQYIDYDYEHLHRALKRMRTHVQNVRQS